MSEERIKALEIGHEQLKSDVHALLQGQAKLDKVQIELLAKFDARYEAEIKQEQTLRNIDNTVNSLNLKLESSKYQRSLDVDQKLNPIYDRLREHDQRFSECPTEVKKDIETSNMKYFKTLLSVFGFVFAITSSLLVYIYIDDKTDRIRSVNEIKVNLREIKSDRITAVNEIKQDLHAIKTEIKNYHGSIDKGDK